MPKRKSRSSSASSFVSRKKRRFSTQRKLEKGRAMGIRNIRTGGLLGVETKFLDCALANGTPSSSAIGTGGEMNPSSGCTGCLSAPGQGDGAQQREGNKIALKSILVKGCASVPAVAGESAANAGSSLFVALVLDTQTNGATLNSEDVFQNPISTPVGNIILQRNMSYTSRFKVLSSKIIPIRADMWFDGIDGNNQGYQVPFTLKKDLNGMIVKFVVGTTTADVTNVIDNSLHILCFQTVAGGVPAPLLAYSSRLRFVG